MKSFRSSGLAQAWLRGRTISDQDQEPEEKEPARPAKAANPDDTSALNWVNPIYDNAQWEPERTTASDQMFGAVIDGLGDLYGAAEHRHQLARRNRAPPPPRPSNPALLVFEPLRHFYRWPLIVKLAVLAGLGGAFGGAMWLELDLRGAFRPGVDIEPGRIEFLLCGLFAYGLAVLVSWAWQTLRWRRDEARPPADLNVDVQVDPGFTAPDIVSAPSGSGAGQILIFALALVAIGAVVGLAIFLR